MIARTIDTERNCRIVIRPNRSMTWRQTKLVYLFIACYSMTIAGGLTVLGFWPVLPFAGGELLALGAAFWVCASRTRATETISVRAGVVAVEKSIGGVPRTWEFQRAWARVIVLRPRIEWYPSRLVIRSHGEQVDIGGFLTEQERRALASELREAIAGTA